MGNRFGNYQSRDEAIAALEADGFVKSVESEYWLKRGKVDDWYGGYESVALVEIVFYSVAPEYGGGGYYQHHFV